MNIPTNYSYLTCDFNIIITQSKLANIVDYFGICLTSVVIYLNIVLFTTIRSLKTIDVLLKQTLLVLCVGNIMFATSTLIEHVKLQIGSYMGTACWLQVCIHYCIVFILKQKTIYSHRNLY